MDNELTVVHTRSYKGEPLAIVKNLPGLDAEMYPAQMHALADALHAAAIECASRPMEKTKFMKVIRHYSLAPSVAEASKGARQ